MDLPDSEKLGCATFGILLDGLAQFGIFQQGGILNLIPKRKLEIMLQLPIGIDICKDAEILGTTLSSLDSIFPCIMLINYRYAGIDTNKRVSYYAGVVAYAVEDDFLHPFVSDLMIFLDDVVESSRQKIILAKEYEFKIPDIKFRDLVEQDYAKIKNDNPTKAFFKLPSSNKIIKERFFQHTIYHTLSRYRAAYASADSEVVKNVTPGFFHSLDYNFHQIISKPGPNIIQKKRGLTQRIEEIGAQLKILQVEVNKRGIQLSEANSEIKLLEEIKKNQTKEIKELRASRKSIEDELTVFKHKLAKKEKELNELEQNLLKSDTELDNLKGINKNLENNLTQGRIQIANLEREVETLKESETRQNNEIKAIIKARNDEIEKVENLKNLLSQKEQESKNRTFQLENTIEDYRGRYNGSGAEQKGSFFKNLQELLEKRGVRPLIIIIAIILSILLLTGKLPLPESCYGDKRDKSEYKNPALIIQDKRNESSTYQEKSGRSSLPQDNPDTKLEIDSSSKPVEIDHDNNQVSEIQTRLDNYIDNGEFNYSEYYSLTGIVIEQLRMKTMRRDLREQILKKFIKFNDININYYVNISTTKSVQANDYRNALNNLNHLMKLLKEFITPEQKSQIKNRIDQIKKNVHVH